MGCVASGSNPASEFEYRHGDQGAYFEDACEAALEEDGKTGTYALKQKRGDAEAAGILENGVDGIIGCETKKLADGSTEYTIEWFYKGAKDSSCMKVKMTKDGALAGRPAPGRNRTHRDNVEQLPELLGNELRGALNARGEQINQLQDTSEEMKAQSSAFAKDAQRLRQSADS